MTLTVFQQDHKCVVAPFLKIYIRNVAVNFSKIIISAFNMPIFYVKICPEIKSRKNMPNMEKNVPKTTPINIPPMVASLSLYPTKTKKPIKNSPQSRHTIFQKNFFLNVAFTTLSPPLICCNIDDLKSKFAQLNLF